MWQTKRQSGTDHVSLTDETKMVQNQLDLFMGLYLALTLSSTVSYTPFSLWCMCTQTEDFMIILLSKEMLGLTKTESTS